MGIYIKKMGMPESCERCPMLDWDLDYVKCKVTDRHFNVVTECWRAIRVPDCPLVPVPPHGRLIDADALANPWDWLDDDGYPREQIIDRVNAAPTVIEAEGGEDGR